MEKLKRRRWLERQDSRGNLSPQARTSKRVGTDNLIHFYDSSVITVNMYALELIGRTPAVSVCSWPSAEAKVWTTIEKHH